MSEPQKSFWVRSGGLDGIVAPIVAFTFIGLAIATYPEFSWVNNALSDLGVVPGATASLFNYGLFLSGLLTLHLAIGLYKFLNNHIMGRIGAVIFFAAGLAPEGIGAAPENRPPFHYIFSVAFFSLIPIALLVIAGYFLISKEKRLAGFTLLIAFLAAAPWILYYTVHYVPGVAIPELLSALAGAAWAVFIGWKMLKTGSQPKTS